MVGKLELILSAILIAVIAISLDNSIKTKNHKSLIHGNTIEIKDAQLIEANSTHQIDDIKAKYAYQRDEIWYFKSVDLRAKDIERLIAKSAIRGKDYFELIGRVKMVTTDGSKYWANRAIYLTDKKIFYTIGRFKAQRDNRVVVGENFFYSKLDGLSKAKSIHGVYQMADRGH